MAVFGQPTSVLVKWLPFANRNSVEAQTNRIAICRLPEPVNFSYARNVVHQDIGKVVITTVTGKGTLLRNANQEGTKGRDLMVKMAGGMQQQMNHHHNLGGYDWSNDFDEPVNYALMAISSSSSSIDKSETDSEISLSVFEVRSSDEEITPANDRFSKADGYHAVPPPITGNFLNPRADISFAGLDEYAIRKKIIELKTTKLKTDTSKSKTSETVGKTNEVNIEKPKSAHESVVPKPKINRDKVIIEDWYSNDEDDVSEVNTVSPVKANETQTSPEPKLKTVVNTGQRVVKLVWDNAKRVNHQKNSNKLKYPQEKRTFVPSGVLTRTCLVNPVRTNGKRAIHTVSTAMPISTARPVSTARPFAPKIAQTGSAIRPIYPRMDNVRPRASYSPIRRSYYTKPAFRPKNFKQDVKTFGIKNMTTAGTRAVVSSGEGKMDNTVKKSRWVWRPKGNYMDHESKENGSFMLKKFEYGNPEIFLQDHAVVDSGCSSHMTGNKAYLLDYEDYNRGFVAFGSDPKGGKIMALSFLMAGDYVPLLPAMLAGVAEDQGEGSAIPAEPQHTPTGPVSSASQPTIPSTNEPLLQPSPPRQLDRQDTEIPTDPVSSASQPTIPSTNEPLPQPSPPRQLDRQDTEIPQSQGPTFTHVADEATTIGVRVGTEGATTTTSRLDARLDSGNIHESPLRSHKAPLHKGHTSGSVEDGLQLKELIVLVPKLVTRIANLEKELHQMMTTYRKAVLTLVERVKSLEVALKRKTKKVVVSDSEDEETENQGRKIQDINDDPLVSLAISQKAKSIDKGIRYKRKTRSKSIEKNTSTNLDAGIEVNPGSEDFNTGNEDFNTGSLGVSTGSGPVSTPKEIQATKRTKAQIQQEEAVLADAMRLQALQEEEAARQVHLDALLAKRISEEEELSEQQKKRKAEVQEATQYYIQKRIGIPSEQNLKQMQNRPRVYKEKV
ncbi:hypothetical protein Tco_0332501 [Tanacetum coccineum]